jgi:hypothetical protein
MTSIARMKTIAKGKVEENDDGKDEDLLLEIICRILPRE